MMTFYQVTRYSRDRETHYFTDSLENAAHYIITECDIEDEAEIYGVQGAEMAVMIPRVRDSFVSLLYDKLTLEALATGHSATPSLTWEIQKIEAIRI